MGDVNFGTTRNWICLDVGDAGHLLCLKAMQKRDGTLYLDGGMDEAQDI